MTFLLLPILCKEYLRVRDDPFSKPLDYIPATMDLRELGLVTHPKDIGWVACGSGAAAVASLAESNILRAWGHYKNNHFIKANYLDKGDKSSDIKISMYYIMNNSKVYSPNKGYYCTQPAEYAINDMAAEKSLYFDITNIMHYLEYGRKFNPEPTDIGKIPLDVHNSEIITSEQEFVYPFYSDDDGNSLILLYHTPFFSLSGDYSFEYDTVDLMKQYLARGVTLIAQIHLGSDKQVYTFYNYNSSDVFAAECIRVASKYQTPSYDRIKKDIVRDGYNYLQERIFYVNIVGYGIKQGQDVWIIKAPFGKDFANLGYLYFPILNNTLCIEEFVATVLPNQISMEEFKKVFTEKNAKDIGLDLTYSIQNLIAYSFDEDTETLSTTDQYSWQPSFAVNELFAAEYADERRFSQITSANVVCALRKAYDGTLSGNDINLFEQECNATIHARLYQSTDTAIYSAECVISDGGSITMLQYDGNWKLQGWTNTSNFLCLVYNFTEVSNKTTLDSFYVYVQIFDTGSVLNSEHPEFVTFPALRCYYPGMKINGTPISSALYPRCVIYKKKGNEVNPSSLYMLGLVPGALRCESSVCFRRVYDTLSKIFEYWNCQVETYESRLYSLCRAPEPSILRPNMKFYGEIAQDITFCLISSSLTPDFVACPSNYNMNFTQLRVRQNSSVSKVNETMKNNQAYNLRGDFSPIMYINIRPDSILHDYLWRINVTFPEIEARTAIDVQYPDGYIRAVEAECKIQTNNGSYVKDPAVIGTADFAPYQIQCRRLKSDGSMYACENLLWYCRAQLFGWARTMSLVYNLNFSSSLPLILTKDREVTKVGKIMTYWKFDYEDVKYDNMQVVSTKKDPENFAFNPCKKQLDVNSDVCEKVVLEDLHLYCDSVQCVPVYKLEKNFFEFTFSYDVVHDFYEDTSKPEFRTASDFFCEFRNLTCRMDRFDRSRLGVICDYGHISCKGVSKTSQTYYSSLGMAVAVHSGTSVFMFNTTDFECHAADIKSFSSHFDDPEYQLSGDFVWTNLLCTINNSYTTYSAVSNSPDYLIRDSNSVDDVKGMLAMQQPNVGLQIFFSVGLLLVVSTIIVISAILSGWPGQTKMCCTRTWNKVVCCERGKVYCTSFDKYGIPLIDFNQPTYYAQNMKAQSFENIAIAMHSGLRGLSVARLKKALKDKENDIAQHTDQLGYDNVKAQLTTQFIALDQAQSSKGLDDGQVDY